MTDRLQRNLNAKARLVLVLASSTEICHLCCTTICKGSTFQSVSTRWTFCASSFARESTRYLVDCCTPVSEVAGHQQLCSHSRHQVPDLCYQLRTFGRQSHFIELFTGSYPWSNTKFWQFKKITKTEITKNGTFCELLNIPSAVSMLHVLRYISFMIDIDIDSLISFVHRDESVTPKSLIVAAPHQPSVSGPTSHKWMS